MKKSLIVLLLLVVMPMHAHAFKWSKCKGVYKSWGITENKSKSIGTVILDYLAQMTSQATFQSSTSTTSYVSSTGDCAAFAKAEVERNTYIAETIIELKMESAEGQGEHVSSLATLYGCDKNVNSNFVEMLKSNHSTIFSSQSNDTPAAINDRITNSLTQSPVLLQNCNLETI